jgi:hypothetical protein
MYDDCDCYTDDRDMLVALIQVAADLRDQTTGLILLAGEVKDGWRRVPAGFLTGLLLQAVRLHRDLARLATQADAHWGLRVRELTRRLGEKVAAVRLETPQERQQRRERREAAGGVQCGKPVPSRQPAPRRWR